GPRIDAHMPRTTTQWPRTNAAAAARAPASRRETWRRDAALASACTKLVRPGTRDSGMDWSPFWGIWAVRHEGIHARGQPLWIAVQQAYTRIGRLGSLHVE